MSMSMTQRKRKKAIREGHSDPSGLRGQFVRKPQTQVVPNERAKQRKSFCRKRGDDGAVFNVG